MKTSIKLLASIVATLPLFAVTPVAVFAVEGAQTQQTTATPPQQSPDTQKGDLQKRNIARKEALKIKLTAKEEQRLKLRCTSAQGKVRSMQGRIKGYDTSHTAVYGGLAERLTKLVDTLKAQDVDTTQLAAQVAVLTTKSNTFKSDLATYKDDISDLAEIDCKTDAVGFKAALEAARTKQAALRQQAVDIKTYVKETIRPTLQTIRKQLAQETTTTTKPETPTTTGGGTQ